MCSFKVPIIRVSAVNVLLGTRPREGSVDVPYRINCHSERVRTEEKYGYGGIIPTNNEFINTKTKSI